MKRPVVTPGGAANSGAVVESADAEGRGERSTRVVIACTTKMGWEGARAQITRDFDAAEGDHDVRSLFWMNGRL